MKKTVGILIFLICNCIVVQGQWYTKRYKVTDINQLTKIQLDESLRNSKNDMYGSMAVMALGGVVYTLGHYSVFDLSDNPTLLEQLMGKKGVNDAAMVIGAGLVIGGFISVVSSNSRVNKIKAALSKNFPALGAVRLLPAVIANIATRTVSPGVSLAINF